MSETDPQTSGDDIEVGDIQNGKAIAIGRDATAVYQGLSVEEVAALVVELKNKDQPTVWNGRIPYLGLSAYQEADHRYFFGRENLVQELLQRVQEANFITIAGPSGSGKSSIARAGLFHALRLGEKIEFSDRWLLADMQPKGDPIGELALALEKVTRSTGVGDALHPDNKPTAELLWRQVRMYLPDDKSKCVLLVDQFEELFTQTKSLQERNAFIDLLTEVVELAEDRFIIVLSLRSDFVSNCASHEKLRELMSQQFQLVGAMAPRDLAEAIILPAFEVGCEIDLELVSKITADMKGSPDALPLMSFALRDLFEAEKTKKGKPMDLTLPEYLQRGGLENALEVHANKVFKKFTKDQKEVAKSIFSKLIEVGQGRIDTRRTASLGELVPASSSAEVVTSILGQLANVRLVIISGVVEKGDRPIITNEQGPTVTIAHEKMIDAWPWLRKLVDENRDLIALMNQIKADAQAWEKAKDVGYLYREGRLSHVEEQLKSLDIQLDAQAQNFIHECFKQREKERQEADKQRQKELEYIEELEKQTELAEARSQAALSETAIKRNDPKAAFYYAIKALHKCELAGSPVREVDIALTKALIELPFRATLRGHQGWITSVAINFNGTLIITGSIDTTARLWDGKGKCLYEFKGHTKPVTSVQFDSYGELLATASADGTVRIWDSNGELRLILDDHKGPVNIVAFNHDSSQIVTASSDGTARLWNKEGQCIAVLEKHTSAVTSAAFDFKGNRILTCSNDELTLVRDGNGTPITFLKGHIENAHSAAFNRKEGSDRRIVTASEEGVAWLWDGDGRLITVLKGHTQPITSAVFNFEGNRIITTSKDGTARLWDENGEFIGALREHMGEIYSAQFNNDGTRIVTASSDNTARLWDDEGRLIATLEGHTDKVSSAIFSRGNSLIVTASADGTACLWDGKGVFKTVLKGHNNPVYIAKFSYDDKRIITTDKAGFAKLWDREGNIINTLVDHTMTIRSVVSSHSGNRILTASEDHTARLWDEEGNHLQALIGHKGIVSSASFNHDDSCIITSSSDGKFCLWRSDGILVSEVEGHDGHPINSAIFSHDGEKILTAGEDGTACIWDSEGILKKRLKKPGHIVELALFSHDSKCILTIGQEKTAILWDDQGNDMKPPIEETRRIYSASFNHNNTRIIIISDDKKANLYDVNGERINVLEGHSERITSATFNHDGSRILTTSVDRTARLWDGDGYFITSLYGHTNEVRYASFNYRGDLIVTASIDGTVRLWEIIPSVQEMRAEAERRLGFLLSEEDSLSFMG